MILNEFLNEFYLEWVLWCVLRLLNWEKDLKHSLQINGFSPEWVLRCILSSPDVVNDLEHSLQMNGFSPEWVLRWTSSLLAAVNNLEHWSQWKVSTSTILTFGGIRKRLTDGSLCIACKDIVYWQPICKIHKQEVFDSTEMHIRTQFKN